MIEVSEVQANSSFTGIGDPSDVSHAPTYATTGGTSSIGLDWLSVAERLGKKARTPLVAYAWPSFVAVAMDAGGNGLSVGGSSSTTVTTKSQVPWLPAPSVTTAKTVVLADTSNSDDASTDPPPASW